MLAWTGPSPPTPAVGATDAAWRDTRRYRVVAAMKRALSPPALVTRTAKSRGPTSLNDEAVLQQQPQRPSFSLHDHDTHMRRGPRRRPGAVAGPPLVAWLTPRTRMLPRH